MIRKVNGKWTLIEEKKVPHPDILPKSGAGQDGTDELLNTYIKDTPGQSRKFLRFKQYSK